MNRLINGDCIKEMDKLIKEGNIYVASCSFGKDSIAMLEVISNNNLPLDHIIFVEPMFDKNLSGLYPEQREWIYVAKERIREMWGYDIEILHSKVTYKEQFYTKKVRGKHIGDNYSFPFVLAPWCNASLKISPIRGFLKQFKGKRVIQYIGIAYDEKKRYDKMIVNNTDKMTKTSPLYDYKITEAKARDMCINNNLLSPIYTSITTRDGCWFCHNQRNGELRLLRKNHPELWSKLLSLQSDSFTPFKNKKTLFEIDDKFSKEDSQLEIF